MTGSSFHGFSAFREELVDSRFGQTVVISCGELSFGNYLSRFG